MEVCIKFELVEKKGKFYQTVELMGSAPKANMLGVTAIKIIEKKMLVT